MEGMEPKKSNGALVGAVIVILILVIGGLWLSKNESNQSDLSEIDSTNLDQVVTPEEIEIFEGVAEDQSPLSTGIDETSIEKDLDGTSFDEFDQDIVELETALE